MVCLAVRDASRIRSRSPMKASAKSLIAAAAVVCGLLFSARPAVAQVTTGNIVGTVTDQQGGVLPGATVVATHVPTGTVYKAVTDKDGRFQMLEVRVGGPYTVVVTLQGFKDGDARDFAVKLGEDHPIDFKLQIQAVNEIVTVGESPIDVSQSGSSSNITQLQ